MFPCVAVCVADLPCQLLVSAWDRSTSVDVLGHWLSVLHVHDEGRGEGTGCVGGWLPREQILGEEARKRVPAEFMAQVRVGNQPSCIYSNPRRSRPRSVTVDGTYGSIRGRSTFFLFLSSRVLSARSPPKTGRRFYHTPRVRLLITAVEPSF